MPSSARHIPPKPAHVTPNAESYWDVYTATYDFEDVEASTLAALCNLHAYAEHCQSMCFSQNTGEAMPIVRRGVLTKDPDDKQMIPNPFMDELSRANREIERTKAALGILVKEKSPVRPTVESPVDRAARKKAEKSA